MSVRTLHTVTAPDGTRIAWHFHEATAPVDEPPVLLTNGIGTTENFWRHLVEDLRTDRRVAHWDYRAHGRSDLSVSGDYSLQIQAADLARVTEAVMAKTGGTAPVQIGFSMGVAVLLELYRTRPELVPSMVLIGGSPDAPGTGLPMFRLPGTMCALRGAIAAFAPVAPTFQPALKAVVNTRLLYSAGLRLGLLQPLAPREDIELFLESIAGMDLSAYLQTLAGLLDARGSDVLPQVRAPVLIIAAQKDTLVPLWQMKLMQQAMPHAQYVEVPDAGHAGMLEAGPTMAREIRAFLDG